MKTVAESPALDQAVADLSEAAWYFLQRVHRGAEAAVSGTAATHLQKLRELARCTGVALDDVPAYRRNTTNWRAIARLAGSDVRFSRAG